MNRFSPATPLSRNAAYYISRWALIALGAFDFWLIWVMLP